ncbi:MAG: serine/threonine-protein kinase [Polyangiales bacterium]
MSNSVHENDEERHEPNSSDATVEPGGGDDDSQVSVRHPPLDHSAVEIETSELDSADARTSDVRDISEVKKASVSTSADEDSAAESESAAESGPAAIAEDTNDDAAISEDTNDDAHEVLPRMLGDRYRLESLIAKGGMGKVYRGRQLPLERSVAVKVLGSSSGLDAAYRRRFLLEASVCAGLTHPNIVVVYDYGEAPDGVLFMAMELLSGRRLSRVIVEDGPMSVARGAFVSLQIARALREAHRQGVAHRDLKPGNVFLTTESEETPDHVKVFDFGLAKVFEDSERRNMDLTMDGVMMGSPRYMSPEQIRGEEVDARADIYAFGAMLYMLFCGRPPFLGEASIDVLAAHIQRDPPTFEEALAERGHPPRSIPPALEAMALRCLEKDASNRYQSMDQPILELKRVLASLDGVLEDRSSSGFALSPDLGSSESHPAMPLGVMRPVEGETGVSTTLNPPPAPVEEGDNANRNSRIAIAIAIAVVIGAIMAVLLPEETTAPTETTQTAQVALSFTSEPAGAGVYLGEVRQGITPFVATYELGTSPTFRFRLEGFEDELVRSEVAQGGEVDVRLRAVAPAARVLPTSEQDEQTPPVATGEREPSLPPVETPTATEMTPATTPMRRNPSVSMTPATPRETTTTPTPETMSERPRTVPLVEPRRGLVDDSTRVPVVD